MEPTSFDVNNKSSWYFGAISRQDATELLTRADSGVFLVRDSSTIKGEYVLSVSEGTRVCHYIINIVQVDGVQKFRMGDQVFKDLQEILSFYNNHYLDSTNLIRPARRTLEQVIAKYDFEGNDTEDLPFKKGEVLTIISKDEEQWWKARNSIGKVGQIPVPYIETLAANKSINIPDQRRSDAKIKNLSPTTPEFCFTSKFDSRNSGSNLAKPDLNRPLPAMARVKQARVPNAYDCTALKLEVDDIIKVTKTNINGQWEGELHGKFGHFPFTHIEFLEDDLPVQ